MQTLTYKDIIDEKVAEWQMGIKKLEEQMGKATSDSKARLQEKMTQLTSAIDSAIVQLKDLDRQETLSNTVEIKDKIMRVFDSIDRDFTGVDDRTPFML